MSNLIKAFKSSAKSYIIFLMFISFIGSSICWFGIGIYLLFQLFKSIFLGWYVVTLGIIVAFIIWGFVIVWALDFIFEEVKEEVNK